MGTTLPQVIAHNLTLGIGYAEGLVRDIPEEKFASMPFPNMTHPAWCLGHLSLSPDRILTQTGHSDLAQVNDDYERLFTEGSECLDDPECSIYPKKDEIVARFVDRHRVMVSVLPDLGDDLLAAPIKNEGMREMFPSNAYMLNFVLTSHVMAHLGQISTWRRCYGLARVF
ncbi:MAG: DinB family protein [Planctomycetes bacterium]|nr:DinB family protein [Planctomycetota bacterium]